MELNTIASWASILGLIVSIISLVVVGKVYNNTTIKNEKSGNRQSSFGVGNTQQMDIK